ncbi:pyridoxine 5'-phosphate synthase [Flavobacteriaceae bacterium]|nr:pyridoxine 5'-phosphate synthase [Flavobacteriaceae bacterium]
MTALSVNINKVATLRNARGGTMPNLLEVTKDLQRYGAQGITVHPRPDQRHIRYEDVRSLPDILTTEFNIEGNPIPKFVDLVMKVKPAQVTLVPDAVDALTSNAGWDTINNQDFLKEIIKKFQSEGIRTSIFIDPVLDQIEGAAATGTDRIELYTEAYAADYKRNREIAIAPYVAASEKANELGLGINAGHDLNLDNLAYFAKRIPSLLEVSIGHALICESLYLGFENVIPMYLQRLSY